MVVYTESDALEENAPETTSFGYLKINVSAAQRALPVYNAQIMVYGSIEERQQELLAVLQTNSSGETEMISLPAPLLAVQIFPGVLSDLVINMQTPVYIG